MTVDSKKLYHFGKIKPLVTCPFKKDFCASFSNTCKYYEFGIRENNKTGTVRTLEIDGGKCTLPKSIRFLKGFKDESNTDK